MISIEVTLKTDEERIIVRKYKADVSANDTCMLPIYPPVKIKGGMVNRIIVSLENK